MQTTRSFLRWSVLILCGMAVGVVVFQMLGLSIFDTFGAPHSTCYFRNPTMIRLHVTSDLLIGLAYVSISSTLAYLVWRASKGIPFHAMFLAFGLFIVSCGFTHFMEVWVVWHPMYWLSGYVKVVTAAASVATAIALFPLVPKVFQLIESVKQAEARRQQIETLNQELEAFTSSVAHDLRAPLRAISGLTLALKEDYADKLDPTARDYAERIVGSAQRMDRLIIDLLDYSRVSSEKVELKPIDLRTIVSEAQSAHAKEIHERDAKIIVARDLPQVLASHTLLLQVVSNLLSNAMKFVAPNVRPEIQVGFEEPVPGTVRLKIRDNGFGIPREHQERIFRMFERLHSDYPGTGIGLAIVEKAVQRMGGKLGLESAPGAGTVFWIDLPKA